MQTFDKVDFKKKLDAVHSWPSQYTFKFIVPTENLPGLRARLPIGLISERLSKNGRYTAVTIRSLMNSSEAVISVYEEVAQIEQVIAL